MLFNSFHFLVFLPTVFVIYWFFLGSKLDLQNLFLLIASYFFYACWDYRFLFLLLFSTALDYYTGIKMHESKSKHIKKTWFWISILINLGFLAVFKYYNFFAESLKNAFSVIGIQVNMYILKVILPIGISFYTFHGLSYVIDIYKNRIKPERNIITYSLFVSFFPLLVAGPIERATHLLPQLKTNRIFNYNKAVDGLRQLLWGFFKKIVIADNCAEYADLIFNNSAQYHGFTLILGAVLFTFQIYCDFSGYSDIALGTARLFGIDLLRNFSFPYFSRSIAEFWRRWHISLSSWFKDYLYIPLGGSKKGMLITIRNTFIIFLVSGFWHGANFTFIIWGLLHAIFIIPSVVLKKNRNNLNTIAQGNIFPSLREFLLMITTFGIIVFTWIFFRAENVTIAFHIVNKIGTDFFNKSAYTQMVAFCFNEIGYSIPFLLLLLLVVEWIGREKRHALEDFAMNTPRFIRYSIYYSLLLLIYVYSSGKQQQFIYFQF